MHRFTRRGLITRLPAAALIPAFVTSRQASPAASVHDLFPRQDPTLVREVVGASHGNVARVKELVSARPALARAVWDWGYGDWESALGAASHVGNKEIAAILLEAGAHPTIFSAAMLGQLDAVKAFVAASPGIQRTRGPHGITLLDHARNGQAAEVVAYLKELGDADHKHPNEPMAAGDPEALLGTYGFGAGAKDRMVVSRNSRGILMIRREGEPDRNLYHHGGRVFNPAGAEAVRIKFEPATGVVALVTLSDGDIKLIAKRV